ncbi:type II toxin-antitoxin system VapC family toxin [Peteryoungia desertarenae]|nr:type II toxin-antitoxin system VapC family toxin [Peteryoungia desertarenae]
MASQYSAIIASHRQPVGRPFRQFDAQGAAIAAPRGGKLSTRNTA